VRTCLLSTAENTIIITHLKKLIKKKINKLINSFINLKYKNIKKKNQTIDFIENMII